MHVHVVSPPEVKETTDVEEHTNTPASMRLDLTFHTSNGRIQSEVRNNIERVNATLT